MLFLVNSLSPTSKTVKFDPIVCLFIYFLNSHLKLYGNFWKATDISFERVVNKLSGKNFFFPKKPIIV